MKKQLYQITLKGLSFELVNMIRGMNRPIKDLGLYNNSRSLTIRIDSENSSSAVPVT